MSKFCRPKVRSTFRRSKQGSHTAPLNYPDPALKWKMIKSMVKAILQSNNAVMEKAS